MEYRNLIKILSLLSIAGVIANLLLFAFQAYSAMVFWIVIVVFAIIAFPVLNALKKKAAMQAAPKAAKKTSKKK